MRFDEVNCSLNYFKIPRIFLYCVKTSNPAKEKPFLFPGSSERPADIFIPNYSGGKNLFIDVAVTCPVQHKYVRDAARIPGFACNDYADEKKTKVFQPRVQEEGAIYLPACFESFGGFSKDLPGFLARLIRSISLRFDESPSQSSKKLYELLSCALQISCARSITSRFPDFFLK
jgi:hypothetical protein